MIELTAGNVRDCIHTKYIKYSFIIPEVIYYFSIIYWNYYFNSGPSIEIFSLYTKSNVRNVVSQCIILKTVLDIEKENDGVS